MSNNEPRFDKNYFTAMALTLLILLGYPFLLKKFYPQAVAPKGRQAQVQNPVTAEASIREKAAQAVVPGTPAVNQAISFEHPFYHIQFSTLGATITGLRFKGETEKTEFTRTTFFEPREGEPGFFALKILNETTDLSREVFRPGQNDGRSIEFVYEKPGEYRLTKKFTLSLEKPVIDLELFIENLSGSEKIFPLELNYGLDYHAAAKAEHRNIEAVVASDKIRSEHLQKIEKKGFQTDGQILWAGLVEKYFAILVKPDVKIISQESGVDDGVLQAAIRMEPLQVAPGQSVKHEVFIYAGPQRYETLKKIGLGFEDVLSRGFFGLFKIWLLAGIKLINRFTHNYGWAIILMTLFLKGAFTPLTHMSYESMKKMQAIQPKLKSLQERYKNDPTKLNKEMMELYRRNKVNPMAGCLPMLAQIPVFIAFYQMLNEMVELRGAPFVGWIQDLSQPDRLFQLPFSLPVIGDHFNLLPLFMMASMYGQQKLTPQAGSSPEQAQMMQFMPIMFGFLFYSMPSGLVLYWFVNNLLTIIHQLFVKRIVVVLHHEDRE